MARENYCFSITVMLVKESVKKTQSPVLYNDPTSQRQGYQQLTVISVFRAICGKVTTEAFALNSECVFGGLSCGVS